MQYVSAKKAFLALAAAAAIGIYALSPFSRGEQADQIGYQQPDSHQEEPETGAIRCRSMGNAIGSVQGVSVFVIEGAQITDRESMVRYRGLCEEQEKKNAAGYAGDIEPGDM